MARTIKFDLEKVLNRTEHQVARWAVLYPLIDTCQSKREITQAVAKLQWQWRARVTALLLDAGYDPRPTKVPELVMFFARNCCPAFVSPDPKTPYCKWPICPFCYARSVVRHWPKIRRAIPARDVPDYPYSLVERHHVSTFPRRTDETLVIGGSLAEAIAERNRFMKSRSNRRLPGVIWYTLVDIHDNHYDLVTRQLFLLEAGRPMPPGFELGKLRHHEQPSGRKVMQIAARLFRYPESWLRGDLYCTLAYLQARNRCKLLGFSGAFRRS